MISITTNRFFEKSCQTKAKHLKRRGQVNFSKIIFRSSIILFFTCICINAVLIYNFFKVLGNI